MYRTQKARESPPALGDLLKHLAGLSYHDGPGLLENALREACGHGGEEATEAELLVAFRELMWPVTGPEAGVLVDSYRVPTRGLDAPRCSIRAFLDELDMHVREHAAGARAVKPHAVTLYTAEAVATGHTSTAATCFNRTAAFSTRYGISTRGGGALA